MFDDDGPSSSGAVPLFFTPTGHAKMSAVLFDDRHIPQPRYLAHIALVKGLAGRVLLS